MECFISSASVDAIPMVFINDSCYSKYEAGLQDHAKTWLQANNFKAKAKQFAIVPTLEGGIDKVLVGVGDKDKIFTMAAVMKKLPMGSYLIDDGYDLFSAEELSLSHLMFGLDCYRFSRYRKRNHTQAKLVISESVDSVWLQNCLVSIYLARDLINTPCEDMGPCDLVAAVQAVAEQFSANLSVISGNDLLTHNYPTIHAVGRAAAREPHLIDMSWGDSSHPKVTLVGKGVCFDSGGLDIKGAAGMLLMKKDMGGAACALALARLIMAQNLPVRLRLLIPAVENSISGNAYRPGDIIKTRAGITVEVTNTDAEGRLVLCDALHEAASEDPDYLFDFATLTGAARVALGPSISALFSNDMEMAQSMQNLSFNMHDPVWHMPLYEPYTEYLKSHMANTVNAAMGNSGFAGCITAALYLQKFVSKANKWAHFDISGWNYKAKPGRPIGGEARSIRTVYHYLEQQLMTK